METKTENPLRALPAVGEFLASPPGQRLAAEFGEGLTKLELRNVLAEIRAQLRANMTQTPPNRDQTTLNLDQIESKIATRLRRSTPAGRHAINATGILLHTGLGRAPMGPAALAALAAAAGTTPLQASLDSGDRSLREERVQALLRELIGCQAATVVNNNAAATMLILNTLAPGKEVIISRGQLIEIGGSFRMTDVMAQSGAILREVGTTNRTHLRDYQAAIGERTGAVIHVHTSNYRIRGFASTPPIADLVALAKKHNLPAIDDLGSGALVPLTPWGLPDEPLVRDSLAAGAAIACFSGDKLICGPQCGIIAGTQAAIDAIRKNPFARMFRVCKLTLAALEATLLEFLNNTYRQNLPLYQMLDRPLATLETTTAEIAAALRPIDGLSVETAEDISYIGSGSIPDEGIPTRTVHLHHAHIPAGDLARRLRLHVPPIFTRLADKDLIIDARTLREGDVAEIIAAVRAVTADKGSM
jgi:L-seryl-tRNA(Ser) seleniumtransferase